MSTRRKLSRTILVHVAYSQIFRGLNAAGFTGAEVVRERAGDGPADRHRLGAPNDQSESSRFDAV